MSSQQFYFKQFEVAHNHSAHKVGTDGALLGAWIEDRNFKNILDVGSGSGVIALMLAQRFPGAQVKGIELDKPSFEQARTNAANSPFAERITLYHGNFLDFSSAEKFDLIISNPPFFRGVSSSGKEARDRARHEHALPQPDFIKKAGDLLSENGILALILPKTEAATFMDHAEDLHLQKLTKVYGSPSSPDKRWLMTFGFLKTHPEESQLFLRDDNGEFSDPYKRLLKDFYLKW